MAKIGVIGIVIQADCDKAIQVQDILSKFSHIIVGRMGVPIREKNVNAISVIVNGTNEEVSALSGKLGKLQGVTVKSALTAVEVE